ncbi:MAG: hypothetical protein K8T25_07930 [Planctomycetia bacterium]|nr:hypothetical protein [Planctomycetia bacterium]
MSDPDAVPPTATPPTAEILKRALKAFKKRLKLTKLDVESSLGVGPMSGGRPSGIVAITPPDQYPREVWDALVDQGRLRRAGHGQYELLGP